VIAARGDDVQATVGKPGELVLHLVSQPSHGAGELRRRAREVVLADGQQLVAASSMSRVIRVITGSRHLDANSNAECLSPLTPIGEVGRPWYSSASG
jgi:hypothetical protein